MKRMSIALVALMGLGLALAGGAVQADPVNGFGWRTDIVDAFSRNSYREAFYGGELARVRVVGDGDTDLDVYVLDENGNLIASDTGPTDVCSVVWQPRWTGPFIIRVVNCGDVYNRFTIYVD
jgi:hypothetical protein